MSVSFSTIVQRARPKATHATGKAMRECITKIAPTNVSALPNGFRVACEENPNAQFATVGVWMDAGSKYETRDVNEGAAKMMELCGFKGTTNQTGEQISRAIEELGGHLHAETGPEHNYVYIKCAKENVNKAVSFLGDIIQNARFADEDIAAARADMTVARRALEENVDELCFQNLNVCAFDSTERSLGNVPLATETAAKRLNKDLLQSFRNDNLVARKMVLVGAGAVSHTQLEKAAEGAFGGMAKTDFSKAKEVESRFVGGDYRLWNLRFKTCHIAWGFETCGATCADVVPLTLATQIHGKYHRSQHEMGQHAMHRVLKAYSSLDHGTPATHFPEQAIEVANPFIKTYQDTGIVGMYVVGRGWKTDAGHAADSMLEILQYTLADWTRMSQKAIHQQELEQAKVNQKAQLLFNMDGSTNTAEDIGKQVLHLGRRVPLEEMYNRIDDVTPNNVMEVLQHYYFARKPVFSMTGALYILPAYDWLTQMTWRLISMH